MITQDDLDWWIELWPTLNWRFASSMPDAPHSYVVKGKTLGDEDFDRAVQVIRTYGEPGKFWSRTNIYLTVGDTKWWTMGAPLADTIIINKAEAGAVFGVQNAPRTVVPGPLKASIYDGIATEYDELYTSPEDLAENERVRALLREHFVGFAPNTLDVGCGTGLLLDMRVVSAKLYTGIDPSQGMLNELVRKHPNVPAAGILPGTAATVLPTLTGKKYDLVCALFAAGSYLEPADWHSMVALSRDLTVIMTYGPGYLPDYWTGVERERMLQKAELVLDQMEVFRSQMRLNGYAVSFGKIGREEITVISK